MASTLGEYYTPTTYAGIRETGFFYRNTLLQAADSVKNPVFLVSMRPGRAYTKYVYRARKI